MDGLNLSARKSQLPASTYPEPADAYVCDKCRRDITRHFVTQTSHSWRPLGPERYTCQCGKRYLTGAVEWIHLSDWEKQRRLHKIFGLGALFSVMISPLSLLVYFLLRLLRLNQRMGLIVVLVVTACPFVLFAGTSAVEVLASLWRTERHTQ